MNIRILPAPVSTGVVFLRTDLDRFPIPASWRHVARVSYATSLMRQGVLISTTEHLLSVFYSMGIDNVYVEIDNLEVPILDGSGLPFVRLIEQAGIRQYRRKRRYLRIRRPISVEDKGKRISIIPDEVFRLTCDTDYPAPVGRQSLELEVTPERYASELAFARTFGWQNDLDQMRNMGLIRGASLENAVCFTSEGPMNPGRPARPRRVLPPQGAGSDRRPRAVGPSPAGSRHRGARRTCHARGAGGAHHERPFALRDHYLRSTGVARHASAGVVVRVRSVHCTRATTTMWKAGALWSPR